MTSFVASFNCLDPDFVVSSIPDGAVFKVSRRALSQHSDIFRDMFTCCDDSSDVLPTGDTLDLDEPGNVLDALLRLLHDPPAFPEMSGIHTDDDDEDDDAEMYLPDNFNPSTVIPLPLLPVLYTLVDKYALSKSIERSLDMHLLLHAPTQPLRVYEYAITLSKTGIASTTSEHVLPLASYSRQEIVGISSVLAYHDLVLLQGARMKALRSLLLKEELFPHDYGLCPHHHVEARSHWEARKLNVMARLECNTHVAAEMKPLEETFKGCSTCQKACIAAVEMLQYKCKKVVKRVRQLA